MISEKRTALLWYQLFFFHTILFTTFSLTKNNIPIFPLECPERGYEVKPRSPTRKLNGQKKKNESSAVLVFCYEDVSDRKK